MGKKKKNKGRDKPRRNSTRFQSNTLVSVVLITEVSDDDAIFTVIKNVVEEQTHDNVDLIVSSFRKQEECKEVMDKAAKLHLDIRWVFQDPNNNFIKDLTDLAEGEIVFYKPTNNNLWFPRHLEVHIDTYNKDNGYGFCLSRIEERNLENSDSPFSTLSWRIDNVPEIEQIVLDEISHVGHVDTDWSVCLKSDEGAPLFFPGLVLKQWITDNRMRGGIPDEITVIQWKAADGDDESREQNKEEYYKQVGVPEISEIEEEVVETDDGIEIIRKVPTIVGNYYHKEYSEGLRKAIETMEVESIALKRTMGMGDVLLVEPIIKKLNEKYPDIPITLYTAKPDIVKYFKHEPDKIELIGEETLVKDILFDKPETFKIDLDLSYESREMYQFVDAYGEVSGIEFTDQYDKCPQLESGPGPILEENKYVVVCADGSGWPGKTWPLEKYAEVIKYIKTMGYNVFETGFDVTAETDSKYHQCTLDQMINLIANCEFYLGTDNGPMHIARGFDKPCVAINGAASTYLSNPNREKIFYVEDKTNGGCGIKHRQFFNLTESGLTFVPYHEEDPSSGLNEIEPYHVIDAIGKLFSTLDGKPFGMNLSGSLVKRDIIPGFAYYIDETGSFYRENPSYHPDQRLNISQVYDGEKDKIWENNFTPLVRAMTDDNIQKDSKILDVGCNMGILVSGLINEEYTDVTGYDINRASILHGKESYENARDYLHIKDFTSILDEEEKYDAVVLSDVISYVGDSKRLLNNTLKVMKSGSYCYINSLVIDSMDFVLNPRGWSAVGNGEHVALFTSEGLRKILTEAGFKNIENYGTWKQEQLQEMIFWRCEK